MNFSNQIEAVNQLTAASQRKCRSIIIEGSICSGKTHLAKQYADMLGVDNFQIVNPKVQDIRDTIITCYELSSDIVVCIENLDTGVKAASNALLKFLEEPMNNVYIIVTCRNINYVADTIRSRSISITVSYPNMSDLDLYARSRDNFNIDIPNHSIWKCVKTFSDIDMILDMTEEQIDYFYQVKEILSSNEAITNMAWKLQKFKDGKQIPISLMIRYIMNTSNKEIWNLGYQCLKGLEQSSIPNHIVLHNFLFQYKYLVRRD